MFKGKEKYTTKHVTNYIRYSRLLR